MFKLTGSDMWLARARAASMALRTAVTDVTMGQAMGTLAYPALRCGPAPLTAVVTLTVSCLHCLSA